MTRGWAVAANQPGMAVLEVLTLTPEGAEVLQEGTFHRAAGQSSALCWIREEINPCTGENPCLCICTHMCMSASLKALPLKSFLLLGLLWSLIPFKVNLAVVHLKTIPILYCLPHTDPLPSSVILV